ncbi:carnitine O-palmitoyltransferase 2, mitochondrial-like [Littorina saxatilis]|uniref:Choline/carnitine acyltransferase domain-containing protein n=1 Tax=Littorina saxatilis TaxID=31220 RepID=A0AAN9BF30_9CAEN
MLHLAKLEGTVPVLNVSVRVIGKEAKFHKSATQSATSSTDRNYLQVSQVPTYHFQKSLPRLPVPKLEKTCERFLKSLTPLVSAEQHAKTADVLSRFQQNEGQVLHQELVEQNKRDKHTSYISGPWFDMYLKDRRPIVMTHNPFVAFNDDPRPEYNTQLLRAANLVVSSARFLRSLKDEVLEPEVYHLNPKKSDTESFRRFVRMLPESLSWYGAYWYKAFPLDMSQYHRLFNSTRIPRPEKDELYTDVNAKHLLVMRNGHFYIFDIFDRDGNLVDETEILAHLQYIQSLSEPPPSHPLGLLTTADRDTWTKARIQLINAADSNELQLQLLDGAAFCLCLDDEDLPDPIQLSRSFLFSDGTNRWFDKSFQLLVSKQGTAAVNFEHAWGDGVAIMRYFKELYKETTTNPFLHPQSVPAKVDSSRVVQKLDFKLDPFVKETIGRVREELTKKTDSLDMNYFESKQLNKCIAKEFKISPDSLMQLTIQLAQYQLTGKCVGTYESCSTSAFKHGRTETVRPCTTATHTVCKQMFERGSNATVQDIQAAIKECSNVHNQLTKEAAMGQGFDRHLFAMRKLAEAKGESPELFSDEGYRTMIYDILSTSTLPDPSVLIGGFCPVVPEGYGVGYAIQDEAAGFMVTAYKPQNNATAMVDSLGACLHDIHDVLEGKMPSRST